MKRIDLYSILINNGYRLPKYWANTMDARADIYSFIKKEVEMTDNLKHKMALYSDEQWNKLVWRLNDKGYRKIK